MRTLIFLDFRGMMPSSSANVLGNMVEKVNLVGVFLFGAG